jgi:hypothetical protein
MDTEELHGKNLQLIIYIFLKVRRPRLAFADARRLRVVILVESLDVKAVDVTETKRISVYRWPRPISW